MQTTPFGNYHLHECINSGKKTAMYKATRLDAGDVERSVAVKQLLPERSHDDEAVSSFMLEAKIAMQLTHGNIAQVLDSGKIDGINYIAIEYIHGKELKAIFDKVTALDQRLPIPFACHTIIRLCQGLNYIHERKSPSGDQLRLVHANICPENILISYDGEVKIIDFGSSKHPDDNKASGSDAWAGTAGYMSPEQSQGKEIDCRSDIFSAGICLYELITGQLLFQDDVSEVTTLQGFSSPDGNLPSNINPSIPNDLERIVLKALANDPNDRYQSALNLHDDLQSFMYSNGYLYSRKEMSAYLRELFSEELAKNISYHESGPTSGGASSKEDTGLIAFDDLEPVSTVSALIPMDNALSAAASPQSSPRVPSAPPSIPPLQPRAGYKATLLGIPGLDHSDTNSPSPWDSAGIDSDLSDAATMNPSASSSGLGSVPPLSTVRRSSSVSPPPSPFSPRTVSRPPSTPSLSSVPPQPFKPTASIPPSLASVGMNFDTDDEATRIYDSSYRLSAPIIPDSTHTRSQVGAPSPFSDASLTTSPVQPLREKLTDMSGWASDKQPIKLIAASVAVIAILSVFIFLVFKEPPESSLHISSIPKDTTVKINGKPISDKLSPFIISELKPEATYRIEVTKKGFRSWSTEIELSPNQSLVLPNITLEPIKSETGFSVDSSPSGAKVYLDDKQLAQVTPVSLTDLAPGIHRIRIEKGNEYESWETEIQVPKGQVLALSKIILQPKQPKQAQKQTTQASKKLGTTTPRYDPFASGTRDSRRSKRSSRTTASPRRTSKSSTAAGMGTLRINTRPWSQVYVDNRLVGNTPQMNIQLPSGNHNVTLVSPTFGIRKNISIKIAPGKTVTKVITLTPGG